MNCLSLYLVRHGQTRCSRAGRICGARCDAPLTDAGHASARALAGRLAATAFAGLYTSPQQRACQTMAPLAERLGRPPVLLSALCELDYGQWDGQTPQELDHADGEARAAWLQSPALLCPPGGESGNEAATRALGAVASIVNRHPSGRVLIVSHKCTLRLLISALVGSDLNRFREDVPQPLGGLSILDLEGQRTRPRIIGAQFHLPPTLQSLSGS